MKIKPSAYPKFFALMRRATETLGYATKEQQDGYYRRVLQECAHCSSVKQIASQAAFDACLARFSSDAGDYRDAIDYDLERIKRTAYVVKVIAIQIMQLNSLSPATARNYFEGVLAQSRLPVGYHADGDSFWLDMRQSTLLVALKMLDTHLRRLKRRHFPRHPMSFSDRIRYVAAGSSYERQTCEKSYYAGLPFSVKVTN